MTGEDPHARPPPAPAYRPATEPVQLSLFATLRDFTRFDEHTHAVPDNPWLVWAVYLAHRLGEARE